MSQMQSPVQLLAMLAKAGEWIGKELTWMPQTATHMWMLEVLEQAQLGRSPNCLTNVTGVHTDVSPEFMHVRLLLEQLKMTCRMETLFRDGDELGVVSTLQPQFTWLRPGHVCTIARADAPPALGVALGTQEHEVGFFTCGQFPSTIACIPTTEGDMIYVTALDAERVPNLLCCGGRTVSVFRDTVRNVQDFDGVEFPMVHLREEADVTSEVGMHGTAMGPGQSRTIHSAFTQNDLRVNHIGAEKTPSNPSQDESAQRTNSARPLVIDRPFAIWMERPDSNSSIPLFFAHVTPKFWIAPKNI